MKNVILHIPHSSDVIPLPDGFVASKDELKAELLKRTEWYTNDLFQSTEAIQVVVPFSSIFCDVLKPEAFADATGLRRVGLKLKELIKRQNYQPQLDKLQEKIDFQLRKHERCLVIECRSFVKTGSDPDIRIGTDDFHTSAELTEQVMKFFRKNKLLCWVNIPVAGVYVPKKYYKLDARVQVIRIEVNQELYLKPKTRMKTGNYRALKKCISNLIKTVSQAE